MYGCVLGFRENVAGVFRGVVAGPLALQSSPITDRQQLGPGFHKLVIYGNGLQIVGVGGFLYIGIVPGAGVLVVRPGDHAVHQVVGGGITAQRTVYDSHSLGTGDGSVGIKGAVGLTVDQAQGSSQVDVLVGPVTGNVGEEILTLIIAAEEADRNGGKLGAGDVVVRLEIGRASCRERV